MPAARTLGNDALDQVPNQHSDVNRAGFQRALPNDIANQGLQEGGNILWGRRQFRRRLEAMDEPLEMTPLIRSSASLAASRARASKISRLPIAPDPPRPSLLMMALTRSSRTLRLPTDPDPTMSPRSPFRTVAGSSTMVDVRD